MNKAELEVEKSNKVAEDEFSELIENLTENIVKNEHKLERTKSRLSEEEIQERQFDNLKH